VNAPNDPLRNTVANIAPIRDEDLEPLTHGPAARALFEEIVSIPRSRRAGLASRVGRPRGPVRVGVAAAAAVSVLVLGLVVGSQLARPKEAVAFSVEGDHIVARIADPEATKQELEDAFAERGLDVRVILEPASPSIVGTIGWMYGGDTGAPDPVVEILYEEGACFTPGGGDQCPVGLKIVNDFEGRLDVAIGRPAAPGEPYAMATDANAPGEILHCTGVRGRTVREALPVLEDRGVRVIWRTIGSDAVQGIDAATIADHYITDALARTQEEVWIWVSSERPNFNPNVTAILDRGC
jgi:hypothetical protein